VILFWQQLVQIPGFSQPCIALDCRLYVKLVYMTGDKHVYTTPYAHKHVFILSRYISPRPITDFVGSVLGKFQKHRDFILATCVKSLLYKEGTKFTIGKVENTVSNMPIFVRRLLESKRICLQDLRFIYIHNAKCCVTKMIMGVMHAHSSNNNCAISVRVCSRVSVFSRCYGCDRGTFSKINKFDRKLNILPSLGTNPHFRTLLHSPYGLDGVSDGE